MCLVRLFPKTLQTIKVKNPLIRITNFRKTYAEPKQFLNTKKTLKLCFKKVILTTSGN